MMISTKGRYALRVMIDLAQQDREGFVSLKEIAGRQDISVKYLEVMAAALSRAGLIESQRGKEGGYRLQKPAEYCSIREVLRAAEGGIAPVDCVGCVDTEKECERATDCVARPMWTRLDRMINDYLDSVSVADLLNQKV